MNIENVLSLIGGLGLFLYGMTVMGDSIEKAAGAKMRSFLAFFTKNRFVGMLFGMLFCAIVQSSSATTVMVVSFVNAGLMNLSLIHICPRRKLFRCSALRTPVMCRSADRNPSARQTTARNREIMRSVRITGREKTEVHRNP